MTAERKAHNDRDCLIYSPAGSAVVRPVLGSAKWRRICLLYRLPETHSWTHMCSATGLNIGSRDSQTYIKEQQLIYMAGKTQAEVMLDKEETEQGSDGD